MSDKINKQKFYIYEYVNKVKTFKVIKEGTVLHGFLKASYKEMVSGYNIWRSIPYSKSEPQPFYCIDEKSFNELKEDRKLTKEDVIEIHLTSSQMILPIFIKGSVAHIKHTGQ